MATVTTQQAGQSAGANPGPSRAPKTGRFDSSVAKKAVMAVTGIIMILFLIAHMIGNLHIFQGARNFNDYSDWLRTFGAPALPFRTLLTVIEIVLVVSVVAHIWAAISLWRQAKRARPIGYVTKRRVQQTYASRTMRWGGVIVGLYIIYHLLDLTWGVANLDGTSASSYDRLVASMSNPFIVAVYVLALVALGFHLRHGVWSATQTLGQSNKRRERAVNIFATVFAVILIGGYLVVPFVVITGIVA